MPALDDLSSRVMEWIRFNTELIPVCKNCARGLRADPVEGWLVTRFTHPVKGKNVRCTNPWFWRGRHARMAAEKAKRP